MTQKVAIIEDFGSTTTESKQDLNFIVLPHPKSANIVFGIMDDVIYELQNYQPRSFASWFINQKVSSSDSIYIMSKVDPRFLLLPFISSTTRYCPIDQILTHTDGCERISLNNIKQWKMHEMCDVISMKMRSIIDIMKSKQWNG